MILTSSVLAAGSIGCGASLPERQRNAPPRPATASQAAFSAEMHQLVQRVERATETMNAVAQARGAIIEAISAEPVSAGAEAPDRVEQEDASSELEGVREELAEVRRRIHRSRARFSPEMLELRRREEQLLRKRRALENSP